MGAPQDRMRVFMAALDNTGNTGLAALDDAVRSISNFANTEDWVDCLARELRHYGLTGRTAEDFFLETAGIDLYNADTGAITGSDAGSGTVKTAEGIVPETAWPTLPASGTSWFRGLTVYWPAATTEAEQRVLYGLHSWWISQGLQLIEESYGMGFAEEGASVREMMVELSYGGRNGNLASTTYYYDGSGTTTALALNINMSYYSDIGTDWNGVSSSAGIYLDRCIAHELVHAVVAANTSYMAEAPIFFREGIAELVHGIDDVRRSTLLSLAASELVLRNSLEVSHTSGAYVSEYAAGYLALRYLAWKGGSGFAGTTFQENGAIHYDTGYTTVVAGAGVDAEVWLDGRTGVTYVSEANNIDASGSDGRMILAGNDRENVIRAGAGEDSLWGGAGSASDVMVGGSGTDVFFYEAAFHEGVDYIQNSDAGDRVMLYGNTLPSSVTVADNTLVLGFGEGDALVVQGWTAYGMNTFVLGDGSIYYASQGSDGNWGMVRA